MTKRNGSRTSIQCKHLLHVFTESTLQSSCIYVYRPCRECGSCVKKNEFNANIFSTYPLLQNQPFNHPVSIFIDLVECVDPVKRMNSMQTSSPRILFTESIFPPPDQGYNFDPVAFDGQRFPWNGKPLTPGIGKRLPASPGTRNRFPEHATRNVKTSANWFFSLGVRCPGLLGADCPWTALGPQAGTPALSTCGPRPFGSRDGDRWDSHRASATGHAGGIRLEASRRKTSDRTLHARGLVSNTQPHPGIGWGRGWGSLATGDTLQPKQGLRRMGTRSNPLAGWVAGWITGVLRNMHTHTSARSFTTGRWMQGNGGWG